MKKGLSLSVLLLLSACAQSATYEDFIKNPAQIAPVLRQCETQATQDNRCEAAELAQRDIGIQLTQAIANPAHYGLWILQAQMELGQLEKQLQAALSEAQDTTKLHAKKVALQRQLALYYTVLKLRDSIN